MTNPIPEIWPPVVITPALRARYEIERRIDEILNAWDATGLTFFDWVDRYREAEAQVLNEMNALKGGSHA